MTVVSARHRNRGYTLEKKVSEDAFLLYENQILKV